MNEQPIPTAEEDAPTPLSSPTPDLSVEAEAETVTTGEVPPAPPVSIGTVPPIRRVVPLILGSMGLLFLTVTVLSLLLKSGITANSVTRAFLDSLLGSGRILSVTAAESLPGSHTEPQSSESLSLPETSLLLESVLPPETAPTENPLPMTLSNETPYQPDMAQILLRPRAVPTLNVLREIYGENAPLVLILHTHGTEAYADCAHRDYRSDDPAKNVISVGAHIADRLTDAGIPVIHLTKAFDSPDFSMAYYNAALEIRAALEEHPSLSYIIDVHRDSILFPDGSYYAALGQGKDGEAAGQIMFVVGTDHGGSGHVGWEDNLSLAARIHQSIVSAHPTMMRDINLRSASFNEQYAPGSLLVEIGSCACTHGEAMAGADIFADALIREIAGE